MSESYIATTQTKLFVALSLMSDANLDPVAQFTTLIDVLRPDDADDNDLAVVRVTRLCEDIESDEVVRLALCNRLLALLSGRQLVSFFADSGILPNSGFFPELWRRALQRVLPAIADTSYLKDCFNLIFHHRDDHVWIGELPVALKSRLWQALGMPKPDSEPALLELLSQMLVAGDVLATRIGAMGVEPDLVRLYPRVEERQSPFLALAVETHQLATAYREYLASGTSPAEDEQQLLVLIEQCREVIARVGRRATTVGTSLATTYLLRRLSQSLERLESLVRILRTHHSTARSTGEGEPLVALWIAFLGHSLWGEAQRKGIRGLISQTIQLLSLRITDNASRTGEHYITSSRADYFEMWRSSMGAGLIVGCMALMKVYFSGASLPPLGYALGYSLIYAGGFMLVHALHFTIATKQPAMTASAIASAISEIRGRMKDVENLATLVIDVIRSQIAAILGNVLIALPTSMLLAVGVAMLTGKPFVSVEKAHQLLHTISPFDSLALLYAAIAGVCLFLAGLISGFFDNLAAFERLKERVEHMAWLKRHIGEARLRQFATYIDNNLGALAGNFFFGIMLGTMGTIGFMTGLPLDIAHVTFASAYFGFALVATNFSIDFSTVAQSLSGIALIGLVNLAVSFTLALIVALRARGVGFGQTRALVTILLGRLRSDAKQFVWPRETVAGTRPGNVA